MKLLLLFLSCASMYSGDPPIALHKLKRGNSEVVSSNVSSNQLPKLTKTKSNLAVIKKMIKQQKNPRNWDVKWREQKHPSLMHKSKSAPTLCKNSKR